MLTFPTILVKSEFLGVQSRHRHLLKCAGDATVQPYLRHNTAENRGKDTERSHFPPSEILRVCCSPIRFSKQYH